MSDQPLQDKGSLSRLDAYIRECVDAGAWPTAEEVMHIVSLPVQESEPVWHGWRVMDTNLHVGALPGRKQIVLYTMINGGTTIRPLAYFKTEDDARTALDLLDKLTGAGFVLDTVEMAA
jgi:hypothetical protein